MLPGLTLPPSLMGLLAAFQPCFTAPSFRTFCALAAGFLAQTGKRTVCGMLTGAGLSRARRHDRAHRFFSRFFSRARWSSQDPGQALAKLIVALLVPPGASRCWSRPATRWSSGPGAGCMPSAGFMMAPPGDRIRRGWAATG